MSPLPLPTRTLAGVAVPNTPLITAALSYAQSHLSPIAYNHVLRSWLLGVLLMPRVPSLKGVALDMELHALAAILHDLGWDQTGALVSKEKRFEVDGADAATEFVRKHIDTATSWDDEHRLQRLWDAIALHTTNSIARHKEPEVAVTSYGIIMDFAGPEKLQIEGQTVVTREEWEAVATEFPRRGLVEGVKEILCGLCRSKAETTYD